MINHSVVNLSTQSGSLSNEGISMADRSVLKALAGKMAELAVRPIEDEKKKLWTAHNDLEATRPLILCDPENGWNEIITEDQLVCTGDVARTWEILLRKEIFWGESMGDDRVVEPYFNIPYVYVESDWGMHEEKIGGHGGGAYRWESPLKDYADLDKLHFPTITVDYKKTEHLVEMAKEIFGDLLTVRVKSAWWWTLGLTWSLVNLRGLEQIMFDMYDYPDELHQLMAVLRDGHLAKLDFLENNELLSLNTEGTYVGSGGFGWTKQLPKPGFNPEKVRTIDMWGFGESQETSQVSPEMFGEFIFPYQLPILKRFGLNCYGCCEPLNKRWDIIKQIPGLRRVSVSAWANLEDMAEKLQNKYIYSMKPSPAYLAIPDMDEDYIRNSLRKSLKITKSCRVEIIMKDNNTLGGGPKNAVRWCQIAQEEAQKC